MVVRSDISIANSIIWGNRGTNDVQIAIRNKSSTVGDPLNSHVSMTHSDVEGAKDNVLIFSNDTEFNNYMANRPDAGPQSG